ncbi:MAG: hypothetical protein IJY89_03930 [Clostridia bacterium]|nr:hypothetical protein [Clostridia bacterium]
MKRKIVSIVLLLSALLLLLPSCFSTGKNEPLAGEADGIQYLFLEEERLLILGGEGDLLKANRLCTLSFFKDAEYLYLGKGISAVDEGIFSPENLKGVYCGAKPEIKDQGIKEELLHFDVSHFEEDESLPFGAVGHCPSVTEDLCMLCGIACYYEYVNNSVRFLVKGTAVSDCEILTEGKKRSFGEDGFLKTDGFDFVGGSVRYFRDNRMITGKADIDGIRYSFSSDGALGSSRPLDRTVPVKYILCIIAALPVGALTAYGVYRIYKKKNALS